MHPREMRLRVEARYEHPPSADGSTKSSIRTSAKVVSIRISVSLGPTFTAAVPSRIHHPVKVHPHPLPCTAYMLLKRILPHIVTHPWSPLSESQATDSAAMAGIVSSLAPSLFFLSE